MLCCLSFLLLRVAQDSSTMAGTVSWKTGPGEGHDSRVESWKVNRWQKTSQTNFGLSVNTVQGKRSQALPSAASCDKQEMAEIELVVGACFSFSQ